MYISKVASHLRPRCTVTLVLHLANMTCKQKEQLQFQFILFSTVLLAMIDGY